ncbi:type II toxin-antitoxin system VapC family toxin [Ancylothrix sp. C2]|uniref:type II toxin-antitoxin system VapC family toxin n=1 Tax=Ancylothrix sp. D3o TaxID=2953691 RepID=UPI0021BAF7A5|nr:type II toxin-antitoxin system VapC family toxin [Ancylothrix sp. D3o]MCT7951651.1 type II toxin-antitoxin system VapC family toxin [Ancylothrix sp. D3o]
MQLLLDTHIFLWLISGNNQLSAKFRENIQESNNTVYLSVVSLWECIIKYQLGKLPLPESPEIYLPKQRELHKIKSLRIDEASVAQLIKLPPLHRDPFDRLLICQSLQHKLIILTADSAVLAYQIAQFLQ